MTYIKTFLPDINELTKNIKNNPSLLNYYLKHECLVGSVESVNYINKKRQEIKVTKNETSIDIR